MLCQHKTSSDTKAVGRQTEKKVRGVARLERYEVLFMMKFVVICYTASLPYNYG
jgi:hypothetical protein